MSRIDETNITLIDPTTEGGSTAFICGASGTGKTSLITTALANILRLHPNRFDVIVIFSESISAAPLQRWLAKGVPSHVHFFKILMPDLIEMMFNINKATNNRYKILFVLDDCVNQLRGSIAEKMIMIYRNAGISTIVSIQNAVRVTPSMRESFHKVWLTGAQNHESRKKIVTMFISGYLGDLGHKSLDDKADALRKMTGIEDNGRSIILLDQIGNAMKIIKIKKPL